MMLQVSTILMFQPLNKFFLSKPLIAFLTILCALLTIVNVLSRTKKSITLTTYRMKPFHE
jgi:hypothetical protein